MPGASFLAFDPSGTYGNDLFVSTSQDILRVSSSGTITPFSTADVNFMRFGPGGTWGHALYAGEYITNDLLTIATDGAASVFEPAWTATAGLDWGQGAGFNGDLIIGGGGITGTLWRVKPDGTH
jgi:hypothetical protein